MASFLLTGGAGFFGSILKKKLLSLGHQCTSIDLEKDEDEHPNLHSIQGDIRSIDTLNKICAHQSFDAIFHCAAILAHGTMDRELLWTSNVDGTRNVAECCRTWNIPRLIFLSSNCLWGDDRGYPIAEGEQPKPIELYGESKWEGEKILEEYSRDIHVIIFRCCTIIDSGRLGLLSILFEFIDEGRKVWVLDGGKNVYQWIAAPDLVEACLKALSHSQSDIFHIGSDGVRSFADVYQSVIEKTNTGARVASLPSFFLLPLMKLAFKLGLSPLGPYQYKMIASNFLFDTKKIKEKLNWKPTITNDEMLWKAYEYYHQHRQEIEARTNVSAHKKPAKMGVIRLLKWMS